LARQLDDGVGDRELRVAANVVLRVLAEEKCRDLVCREQPGDARDEPARVVLRHRQIVDRAERVDDDDFRRSGLDCVPEPFDEGIRPVLGE